MIEVTGKIPKILVDSLSKLGVVVSDVQVVGDDIDVIFTKNSVMVSFYAIYVGNYKWVVDELDDPANLFPNVEEGDTVSVDALTKMFTDAITSSLILSYSAWKSFKNKVKDKVADAKAKRIQKAMEQDAFKNDKISPDECEQKLRQYNKPLVYADVDDRTGEMAEFKFDPSGVNLGKISLLNNEQGNYKVLTGNPKTQDFQVWHVEVNGDEFRVEKLMAGLGPNEAKYVYDNNLPDSWPSDLDKEEEEEENNVVEEDSDADITLDESQYTIEDVDDNVIGSAVLRSGNEKDNVIKGKRKKSRYNGRNVTGCVESDGSVSMA